MRKLFPLVWVGVWRKPMRSVLTALAVFAAFTMLGALGGIDAGFRHVRETAMLDRLFVDPRFGAPLPISYLEQISAIPGVTLVAPRNTVGGFVQDSRNTLFFNATDERFFAMRPEIIVTDAQKRAMKETPNGVLVGSGHAKKYGWKVGDQLPLQSLRPRKDGSRVWPLEIVGIIDTTTEPPGTTLFALMNFNYFDESVAGQRSIANRILVRIANPDDATRIGEQIDSLFANSTAPTRTVSERTSTENNLQGLGDITFAINGIAAAVLFMLLFLTGNTMSQAAHERMGEFAVMKAMGFEGRDITLILTGEALLQCVPAAILGLLLGAQLVMLAPQNFPRDITPPWTAIALGTFAAAIVAIVSSSLPAWRLERRPLTDALRD